MMRKLFKFVMALCLATFAIGALAWTGTTGSIGGTVEWRNHRRPSLPTSPDFWIVTIFLDL